MNLPWKITKYNLQSELEKEFLCLNEFLRDMEEGNYSCFRLNKFLRAKKVSEQYEAVVIDFQYERLADFGNLQIIRTENNSEKIYSKEELIDFAIKMGIYIFVNDFEYHSINTIRYVEVERYEDGFFYVRVDGYIKKINLEDKDKTWSINYSTLKERC